MNTQRTTTLFSVLGLFCAARLATPIATAAGAAGAQTEPVTILERGPHHRVVQNASGGTYTELGDGLCYEENGVLKDSQDIIELNANGDGAIASKGRHKASFPPSIGSPITVTLPDRTRWVTKPFGLAYFNSLDGSSVLIAEVADVVGELHPPNQVVYPRALPEAGADIRYTYSHGSFAQDIIVRGRLPDPMLWNFPPEFTRLECWTEILEAPKISKTAKVVASEKDAEVRAVMAAPDVIDEALTFSAAGMHIGKGKAFPIDNTETSIPVSKQSIVIDGRRFLIETIEYPSAEPILKTLPAADQANAAIWKQRKARPRSELLAAVRPKQPQQRAQRPAMKMAQAPIQGPALVADYDLYFTASYTDFTFIADHTYAIYGQLTLGGTTTLEGGAVIKFPPYSPSATCQIKVSGTGAKINCNTAPYRPAIFTARDDDTVGEVLSGSTGTPSGNYGNYAIYFDSSAMVPSSLHDIRVRYTGIYYATGTGHLVRHSQFVGGLKGIEGSASVSVRLQNVLFSVYQAFNLYLTVRAENLTISGYAVGGASVFLTNSLINVSGTPSYYGPNNFFVTSGAFQTVGAGSAYLADETYVDAGTTTAIDPAFLAELAKRTTRPPVVLTGNFTIPTVLSPFPRDSGLPACGYHYDPVDFAWSDLTLSSSLTLTGGVVVAHYGTSGTRLDSGAKFISEGLPVLAQRNHIVQYTAVQEGSLAWGSGSGTMSFFRMSGSQPNPAPQIYLRFTDVDFVADVSSDRKLVDFATYSLQSLELRDCELSCPYLSAPTSMSSPMTITFINNLFRRANFTIGRTAAGTTTALLYNNLFLNSMVALPHNVAESGAQWAVYDNLFDAVTLTSGTVTIPNSNNGYIGTTGLSGSPGGDKFPAARQYQSASPGLGTNYYPSSGIDNLFILVGNGSRPPATAGLYHHTVKTDQSKAGTLANVSIGYHYVALTSGLPADNDSDLFADYLEDRNGDGTAGTGETPWQVYTSLNNLSTTGTGLQVLTPLK